MRTDRIMKISRNGYPALLILLFGNFNYIKSQGNCLISPTLVGKLIDYSRCNDCFNEIMNYVIDNVDILAIS